MQRCVQQVRVALPGVGQTDLLPLARGAAVVDILDGGVIIERLHVHSLQGGGQIDGPQVLRIAECLCRKNPRPLRDCDFRQGIAAAEGVGPDPLQGAGQFHAVAPGHLAG